MHMGRSNKRSAARYQRNSKVGIFVVQILHHKRTVFPLRKFYTEQMFALVRMQLRNYVDTQLVKP